MTKEKIFEEFRKRCFDLDNVKLFNEPSYETAIIGISHQGNVCYSFTKMINYLVETAEMTIDEAIDFITYCSLPLLGSDDVSTLDQSKSDKDNKLPIIVYDF